MIEKIVLDYLKEVLEVPVHTDMPEHPENRFVLIEKTGGSKENFINFATITLQSYAESRYRAAELNEQVKTAMDNIIILDSVGKSKLNADYNYPDTTKKKPRYQAVYELTY